ncbi:DUF2851 family protein [Puia sp. P3]|uniref:DUF2851 family protein n=1 Tax=Puia sp. P3 TaxID=3423952 RepID=UPI003D671626
MREDLLQFIWRYSYFNQSSLFTEAGEELSVVFPGVLNTGAGPDFRHARIRIGGVLQEGPVEVHIRASDWDRHGHSGDDNYRGVILHVVWEADGGPANIPVFVLQERVPKLLLAQYEGWMRSQLFVPCATRAAGGERSGLAGLEGQAAAAAAEAADAGRAEPAGAKPPALGGRRPGGW